MGTMIKGGDDCSSGRVDGREERRWWGKRGDGGGKKGVPPERGALGAAKGFEADLEIDIT